MMGNMARSREEIQKLVREELENKLPEFFTTDMDGGVFYRSLEPPQDGQVITDERNKEWVVRYWWEWTRFADIPVYIAELDPRGFTRHQSIQPTNES